MVERGRRRSGLRLAALGLVVSGCLSACGGLPDSGSAGPGRDVGEAAVEPLRVAPQGPRPGAGPKEVVGGFLRAGGGFDDDHATARTFLVGAARGGWAPGQGVVVYPDDASLTVSVRGTTSPVQVDVRAPVSATIDADGRYRQAAPGTVAHAVFTVVQSEGQWRVSVLDADLGLWLPQYEVDRAFSPMRLYFVAAGTRSLVPDLRWLPGPRPGLATTLARALLAGPPAYLQGAVTTGAPDGTRLAVEAVPTTDGIAQVDLTPTALEADPDERVALWAQLTTTLRQLPSVSGLHLTAGGAAYPVRGVASGAGQSDQGYRDDVRVAGDPLVLSGDRLLRVDAGSGALDTRPSGSSSGLPATPALRSVSAAPRTTFVVGVSQDGGRLLRLRADSAPVPLATGHDLVDPVVDARGWTWTSDVATAGRLTVVAPGAPGAGVGPDDRTVLDVPWLAGRTVRSVDVSRDGARAAVISSAADGPRRLDVAGVVRDADGRPRRLAQPLAAAASLSDAHDVAWADRTSLVVLARGSTKAPLAPYQVSVGGTSVALPPAPGVTGVTVGDGLRAVYLTTASGQVLTRSGSGWRTLGRGRSVTVPE